MESSAIWHILYQLLILNELFHGSSVNKITVKYEKRVVYVLITGQCRVHYWKYFPSFSFYATYCTSI